MSAIFCEYYVYEKLLIEINGTITIKHSSQQLMMCNDEFWNERTARRDKI